MFIFITNDRKNKEKEAVFYRREGTYRKIVPVLVSSTDKRLYMNEPIYRSYSNRRLQS